MTFPEDYLVDEIRTNRHSNLTIVAVSLVMIFAAGVSLFLLG